MTTESVRHRAWKDTEHFRQSSWFFWGCEVIGAALFAAVGYWLLPEKPSKLESSIYPVLGVVFGFAVVFVLILMWNLVRAPYNLLNEARAEVNKRLEEKNKFNQEHISQINEMQKKLNDPFLQKAQEKHLEKIKTLIEDWNNCLVVPPISQVYPGTSPLIDTLKSNALFANLRQHLPFEKLWQNYTIWDTKIREYLDICRKLKSEIYESWNIEGTKPSGNQFAEPILRWIEGESRELRYCVFFAKGHSLEEIRYQVLDVNSIQVVLGLEFSTQDLERSDDRTLILPVEYDKLAVEFLGKEMVSKAKQFLHDLSELKGDMSKCLA